VCYSIIKIMRYALWSSERIVGAYGFLRVGAACAIAMNNTYFRNRNVAANVITRVHVMRSLKTMTLASTVMRTEILFLLEDYTTLRLNISKRCVTIARTVHDCVFLFICFFAILFNRFFPCLHYWLTDW
jgi:hypothetical protein